MKSKIKILIVIVLLLSLVGCKKEVTVDDKDTLNDEYERLQQDYNILIEEFAILESNIDEVRSSNEMNKGLISEYKDEIVELKSKNESLVKENSKLQDESNEEIWNLQNESFQYMKSATFWEQGMRTSFKGEPYLVCKSESLASIHIGDTLGEVIEKYGNDFEVVFSDDGFEPVVVYDGVSLSIGESNYCVTELFLATNKYETSLGVRVGDNAVVAIDNYKELYRSNEDGSIHTEYPKWLFDLGEGYVIQFQIDTDELTENSVITSINLRNFYHGEV